jgi:hypothetical protein
MSAPDNTRTSLGSDARSPIIDSAFVRDATSHTLLMGYDVNDWKISGSCVSGLRPGDAFDALLINDNIFVIPRDLTTARPSSFYVPLNDNGDAIITILPAHKQHPRTDLTDRPGLVVDVSVENVAQIRLRAGEITSIECVPAGCEVSDSFTERYDCLDPAPDDRSRLPSLWVSRAGEHHQYRRILGSTHDFRIVSGPTTAPASTSDRASHLESETTHNMRMTPEPTTVSASTSEQASHSQSEVTPLAERLEALRLSRSGRDSGSNWSEPRRI